MDADDILMMIFTGFLGFGIPILFWIGTLIFGIVMQKRGGGKPERVFITGAVVSLLGTLLRIPLTYLTLWLYQPDMERSTLESISSGVGLFVNSIASAGVIILIYSFWLKFNGRRVENAVPAETEQ